VIIPPRYRHVPDITELLASIEASKQIIDAVTIPPEIENNIRRKSTLKSALFSARVEGNPLTMDELVKSSETQKKLEVMNILKATNYLYSTSSKDVSSKEILKLHEITMKGLATPDNVGRFRRNMEAIFNSAGIAIYMPPPPRQVPALIERLVKYTKSEKEKFVPVKAVLAHYVFEKIHPFLDGSGRVGRLLLQKVLIQGGYGMKGLLPFEEYIDNHRSEYYRMLDEPDKDATDYILFMLTAIDETAKKAREEVLTKKDADAADYLLPRRAEIYNIIRDLKLVQFDQIRRRFSKVNERTLRYDLKKLQDQGLIRKLGETRGVYYEPV
jgi:Fic family protein